jgi:hypothetical protein
MRGVVGLLLAWAAAALYAQPLMDDFFGGFDPQHGWSWVVPGNAPANTHDPARVGFTAEHLQITAQAGALYQGVNNIRNLPSVSVPALRGAWVLETRVRLTRGGASGGYIQAGLVAFRDADHYFNLHLVHLPEQSHCAVGQRRARVGGRLPVGRAERHGVEPQRGRYCAPDDAL